GGDPTGERAVVCSEDTQLVGAGLGHDEAPTVGRQGERDRARAVAGGTRSGERSHDGLAGYVKHGDTVRVGDSDVCALTKAIYRDPLWMREMADVHIAELRGRGKVDEGHRPTGLVRDEARPAVRRDRRAVRIASRRDVGNVPTPRVDNRGLIGEVQWDQERGAVTRDREAVRPGDRRGVRGREVLRRRRVGGGRDREKSLKNSTSAAGAVTKDVH